MSYRILCATLLTFAATSHAAVIYNNGVPDNINGLNITQNRTADDFTLASSANLSAIRFFWVGSPTAASFNGTITYAIYNDSTGAIGSLVSSATVSSLGSTATGGNVTGLAVHQTDIILSSALALSAGTYWLELHEGATLGTNDGTFTFWATSSQGGNAKLGGLGAAPVNAHTPPSGLAFQLSDDAASGVPEPSALALVGAGLGAALLRKGRRA